MAGTPFTFELNYGGTPFLTDRTRTIRPPGPPMSPDTGDEDNCPPRLFQPEMDLMDEINRLIPLEYLQDYTPPGDTAGRNVFGLARRTGDDLTPQTSVRVGDWYYPTGCSRWGVFRGLANSEIAAAMVAGCQAFQFAAATGGPPTLSTTPPPPSSTPSTPPTWSPQLFTMQNVPVGAASPGTANNSAYLVQTDMYMLPPRPIWETNGSLGGLYLITLVDERYWFQYSSVTLRINQSTTWDELINNLAVALGITLNFDPTPAVYGSPEPDSQLWVNEENAAYLLDCVAYNTGRCVIRNMDGTYALLTWAESQSVALANRAGVGGQGLVFGGGFSPASLRGGGGFKLVNFSGGVQSLPGASGSFNFSGSFSSGQASLPIVRIAGGDIFQSGNVLPIGNLGPSRGAIVPADVEVTFPKYVYGDDPVPHFLNPRNAPQRPSCWYQESYGEVWPVNVPIASGGPQFSGIGGTVGSGISSGILASGAVVSGVGITSGIGQVGFSQTITDAAKALYSGEISTRSYSVSGLVSGTIVSSGVGSGFFIASGSPYLSGNVFGGTPSNASGLIALAMQVASDYYAAQTLVALDEVWPGTYCWQPEGFHDILWTWSDRSRGVSMRVMRTQWNNYPRDFQHSSPPLGTVLSGNISSGVSFTTGPLSGWTTTTAYNSGDIISGMTNVPRGVGGPLVAQTWRDSFSGCPSSVLTSGLVSGDVVTSGVGSGFFVMSGSPYASGAVFPGGGPSTTLGAPLLSGDPFAVLAAIDYFPTQNRWRGTVGQETILFEGTSGGYVYGSGLLSGQISSGSPLLSGNFPASGAALAVGIVYRAIDGSYQSVWNSGDPVSQNVPDTVYGVNLVTAEKGQFFAPGRWTSGGIQEVVAIPQTQTVQCLDDVGALLGGLVYYSGAVNLFAASGGGVVPLENVWLVERNDGQPTTGDYYDGQFAGYSPSGTVAPVYLFNVGGGGTSLAVDDSTINGTPINPTSGSILSGNSALTSGGSYVPLIAPLGLNDPVAQVAYVDFLPTQNRWKAAIPVYGILSGFIVSGTLTSGAIVSGGSYSGYIVTSGSFTSGEAVGSGWSLLSGTETVLFEGTSGGVQVLYSGFILSQSLSSGQQITSGAYSGYVITSGTYASGQVFGSGLFSGKLQIAIVARGLDGTVPAVHLSGFIQQNEPERVSGVSSIRSEKGQYIYQGKFGDTQEVVIVPQIQGIQILDASGIAIGDAIHFSGQVNIWDETLGGAWRPLEYCWAKEENNAFPVSGNYYKGLFAGYTGSYSGAFPGSGPTYSGTGVSPVYLVSQPTNLNIVVSGLTVVAYDAIGGSGFSGNLVTWPNVTELQIDTLTGLGLPTNGLWGQGSFIGDPTFILQLLAATPLQNGGITNTTQIIGGMKTFEQTNNTGLSGSNGNQFVIDPDNDAFGEPHSTAVYLQGTDSNHTYFLVREATRSGQVIIRPESITMARENSSGTSFSNNWVITMEDGTFTLEANSLGPGSALMDFAGNGINLRPGTGTPVYNIGGKAGITLNLTYDKSGGGSQGTLQINGGIIVSGT